MNVVAEARITLYTTAMCPFCRQAERLLDHRKIPYRAVDADDPRIRSEIVDKTGWRTVPIILLDGQLIGGYQELLALDRSGQLEALLA